MMTLQAREWMQDTHRPPQNSDDMARTRKYLAMLAVIAEGNFDLRAFDDLERQGKLGTLDLEREDILRALLELYRDRIRTSDGENARLLRETLDALMDPDNQPTEGKQIRNENHRILA